MNPRQTTDKIRDDYESYLTSILTVKDRQISKLASEEVKKTEFIKGPYLETTLPFKDGKSLKELAEEGLISKEFEKMGPSIHYDSRKLRIHQEDALRHIIEKKRNLIVSTGTGSGKTECYLYPIFNEIMREKEAGTLGDGVRALLIFPMNALANDQQKKLRKLLKDYPDITFGRYTGETPHIGKKETPDQAEERLHNEYDQQHTYDTDPSLRKSIPNEFMSREKMVNNPPHILLTNYAMLEMLLLRPDTSPFFDNESAKNWKFIIIDEAHTYKGANGSEIAFLLRRLKERIRHNMKDDFKCIATSATLGSNDDEGKAGLAAFAENLFGEPFTKDDVVTTERKNREIPEDGRRFNPQVYIDLKAKTEGLEEFEKGTILFDELSKDLRLFDIYKVLNQGPKNIDEVASKAFADIAGKSQRLEALVNLIELAAAAKKSEYDSALLPARYHLFIKSLEGMFVQYRPEKHVFLDRRETVCDGSDSYAVFEMANCQKCGQEYILGKTINRGGKNYLYQTSNDGKPEFYFVSNKSMADLDEFDEDDTFEEMEKVTSLKRYNLCLCCGQITEYSEKHSFDCCDNDDPSKIVSVYNLNYSGKDNESNCCPCCGATQKGLIKRFLTANQPATFAIAKSLYDAIPPRPYKEDGEEKKTSSSDYDDLFDDMFDDAEGAEDIGIVSDVIDESGRKLLIFSDNRQEAAFFAGFFDNKYNVIMWRRAIIQTLKESKEDGVVIKDLVERLWQYADRNGLYSIDKESNDLMTPLQKRKMAAHYVMQEFLNPDTLIGLERMGIIKIYPDLSIKENAELFGVKRKSLEGLLYFMMDSLRSKGIVSYVDNTNASDQFFAPKNYECFFRKSGSENVYGLGKVFGFSPAANTPNKRLNMMIKLQKLHGVTGDEAKEKAREELNNVYGLFTSRLVKQKYIDYISYKGIGGVYRLNNSRWKFALVKDDDKLYRCKKCGKIYSYSMENLCPELKCDGTLEKITKADITDNKYYQKMYSEEKIIPMVAREHTAQLNSQTAREYQTAFEDGKINVLSCSTTFEMGVDVGELEATFQRNVPPETANYIQRAGRAGRRTSSAAFSVTFSRRNSHDLTFFQNPAQIIAGKISPPVLEVTNEKIAQRHLNSIIISWFFKQQNLYYENNAAAIVEDNMALALRKCLMKHPQDLLDSIHAVMPENLCNSLGVDEWTFIEDLTGEEGSLTKAITSREEEIEELRSVMLDPQQSRYADNLIKTLRAERSLTFLSAKGVLPKYGFPIDTVNLDILNSETDESKKIELSRDLKMAISEFAPPMAQIVANGRVWSSYAINTRPGRSWPNYVYYECPQCHRIHPPEKISSVGVNLTDEENRNCTFCGTLMNAKKFIIPIFGFSTKSTDKSKPVGETRPSTYYPTRTQFWGIDDLTEKQKSEAMEATEIIGGKKISKVYSPGGMMFILNQGANRRGFKVCPTCGYTTDPAFAGKEKRGGHKNKFDRQCGCKTLQNVSLGHRFSTDIMKIELPKHTVVFDALNNVQEKDQMLSVLYAILEGACSELDISRSDISGCIDINGNLVLFDDTPGGSGFVKRVYIKLDDVLRAAKRKVSGQCGCTEETSCYGCLRSYSNQYFHDDLSRGLAYHYLSWLLDESQVETKKTEQVPVENKPIEESIGTRTFDYNAPNTTSNPDSKEAFEYIRNVSEDADVIDVINKILKTADFSNLENPLTDTPLPVENDIYPEIFWPNSKVALFTPDGEDQYDILKKYDWYCYLLNANIDIEKVFSHIKKEGK